MPRIQYKQIEQIAAKHDVGFARSRWYGEIDSPAVRLSGFLSNIESALIQIRKIAGDSPYFEFPNDAGIYLVR